MRYPKECPLVMDIKNPPHSYHVITSVEPGEIGYQCVDCYDGERVAIVDGSQWQSISDFAARYRPITPAAVAALYIARGAK